MMGRPDAPEQKGLIPRSLEQIFQTSQALSAQGWKYKMQVKTTKKSSNLIVKSSYQLIVLVKFGQASMLEIYNETLRDLLGNQSSGSDGAPGKQYAIKHDQNGNTYVSDLTIVDVCSIKEISSLLRQAAQSR